MSCPVYKMCNIDKPALLCLGTEGTENKMEQVSSIDHFLQSQYETTKGLEAVNQKLSLLLHPHNCES